ncbi:MAG: hypothetical protein KDB03_16350 [Planctomycetales bacterium]|nr:hypothetical protein [Planctomycetales bacterium]
MLKKILLGFSLALLILFSGYVHAVADDQLANSMSLANGSYSGTSVEKPLTYSQQIARMQHEQRLARMEFDNWIGFSPARPTMGTMFWSYGTPSYYLPSRNVIVRARGNPWYW